MTTLAQLNGLTNVSSVTDIAVFSNNISDGYLFMGFTIVLFIVLILAFKRFDFKKGLLAAAWISFVISGIFWYMGLLSVIYVIMWLIITVVTAFIVFMEG